MKRVRVAAAVILQAGQVFLAKRKMSAHQGGLWEFPGGKVELGETPELALQRELLEEVGIEMQSAEHFISIPFEYPDKSLLLDIFIVTDYKNAPWGKEGQLTKWAKIDELRRLDFPAANHVIIDKLCAEYPL